MTDTDRSALPWQRLSLLTKGLPLQAGRLEIDADEVIRRRLNVLRGDVPLPVAVLKASALDHNSR